MRMSCNGCRVLRKGCPDDCTLRPCLQWLKSPESEANATLFLAKFYGRAGLINLINAGPTHLRPQIFVSLLYEACGRIVNPVEGSVGLMCSGDWRRCQAAVEAVLQGRDSAPRSKDSSAHSVRRVRPRNRFKRSAVHGRTRFDSLAELVSDSEAKFTITGWDSGEDLKNLGEEVVLDQRARSHDSSSVETVEPALAANRDEELVRRVRPEPSIGKIGLELTLGPNPSAPALHFYSDRDF